MAPGCTGKETHAAIPVAFWHNMATYAQFWGVLKVVKPGHGICNSEVCCYMYTRVAWFSHKSGGSNAHLLPEVLVNTDTHLDLFDSESEDASDFEELFAMPLQPMEEWVVFLIMGSVLPGYMFWYRYCLIGGLEAIVFGAIRWCVWSCRPSSPLRLPHLKCLLLLLLLYRSAS